jgi:hypothetical protein
MKTPKFFELIGSSKERTDPQFRLYVELTDKDEDFWESQRHKKLPRLSWRALSVLSPK